VVAVAAAGLAIAIVAGTYFDFGILAAVVAASFLVLEYRISEHFATFLASCLDVA